MQAISDLDFSKIILRGPTCGGASGFKKVPFGVETEEEMRFVSILYPKRTPQLTLSATVVECNSLEFGTFCKVKPETKDLHFLEALEGLLDAENEHVDVYRKMIGWDGEGYEHAPTLDDSFLLRLKMPTKENGNWKFETNVKDENEAIDFFVEGMKVDVVVGPGFYFNSESKRYGLYYSLKSLYPSILVKPVKSAKTKK